MEADPRQIEIYQRMRPAERIGAACALHDFAHQRILLHLKRTFPGAPERWIHVEAAWRFLGESARVLRDGAEGPREA